MLKTDAETIKTDCVVVSERNLFIIFEDVDTCETDALKVEDDVADIILMLMNGQIDVNTLILKLADVKIKMEDYL